MIGVDTTVLVRLLTADMPEQYDIALNFFDKRSSRDPVFVSAVTLVETIWVLRRSYKYGFDEIQNCIIGLLDSEDVEIEGRDHLLIALENGLSAGLFADVLVSYLGQSAGCTSTVTFDRRAAQSVSGMELLS